MLKGSKHVFLHLCSPGLEGDIKSTGLLSSPKGPGKN